MKKIITPFITLTLLLSFTMVGAQSLNDSTTTSNVTVDSGSLFSAPQICDPRTEKSVWVGDEWTCAADNFEKLNVGFDEEVWCYIYRRTFGRTIRVNGRCIESQPGAPDWAFFQKNSSFMIEAENRSHKSQPSKWDWSMGLTYPGGAADLAAKNLARVKQIVDGTPFQYFNNGTFRSNLGMGNIMPCKLTSNGQSVTCDFSRKRNYFGDNDSEISRICPMRYTSPWYRYRNDDRRTLSCL